jgi:hypothetical protein
MKIFKTLVCLVSALSVSPAFAAEEIVKDNSFLIEEAYNQEAGVVQFIFTDQYLDPSQDGSTTFTNEIPLGGETHQFSYVIPMQKIGTTNETGLGDILLNYRYQIMNNEHVAMAPRISLVLPTGDYKKDLGTGSTGVQFNQAVSITLNEKWTNHWNAGFTYIPGAKDAAGDTADVFGFNFGTSVVYNWTPRTNLLCEFVTNSMEKTTGPDTKATEATYYILPGIRTAFNAGGTEIVPGLGAMIGVGPSADEHETGIFAYLSFESKLW